MNLVIRKIGRCPPFSHMGDLLNTCMLWIGLFECHILLENPVNSGMNRNSDRHSGSGLPNPEFSKTLLRFRLNRSRIFNISGIRPDIPVPSRAYLSDSSKISSNLTDPTEGDF